MQVVKTYGRTPNFDFDTSNKLKTIKIGQHGDQSITTRKESFISIDSFMTIWLLTLPEKFKEWYEFQNSENKPATPTRAIMSLKDKPKFPKFAKTNLHTHLVKNPNMDSYEFLPET